jgi:hypothetical protein
VTRRSRERPFQIRRRRRDAEIVLHDRAGAADLVTHQRAEIGREQLVKRTLDAVPVGLVLRRDLSIEMGFSHEYYDAI